MEVLCRGAFGMDAKLGTMGQGWPTVTTLGTAPERGKFRAAKPGCRVRLVKAIHGLHPSGRLKPSRFAPGESVSLVTALAQAYGAKRSNSRRLARRASVASQEKVTRRKGETGSSQARNTLLVQRLANATLLASAQSRRLNRACS